MKKLKIIFAMLSVFTLTNTTISINQNSVASAVELNSLPPRRIYFEFYSDTNYGPYYTMERTEAGATYTGKLARTTQFHDAKIALYKYSGYLYPINGPRPGQFKVKNFELLFNRGENLNE
ncbi:hypothetical protein [Falseniella ignava]|uniref:Uncharacterized protein n=1 Tax=Falseniella ignava CCUG 37419 TaxID=883112 RepID=K1LR74_9LACT|nr:hypothetical protein [Falseniella ignava]EKB57291.1 hypothetical protein HMPREF9707_00590 [Falseniella ignava CCUG 37419]